MVYLSRICYYILTTHNPPVKLGTTDVRFFQHFFGGKIVMNSTWKFIFWMVYQIVKALLFTEPPNGDDIPIPENGK